MARSNSGIGPDPFALMQLPGTAPNRNSGLSEGFGSWLSALGMALMSSPRNAPLQNFPNTLAPMLQMNAQRGKQQMAMDFVKQIMEGAPPSQLTGADDDMPAPGLMGMLSGQNAGPSYPSTGSSQYSAGGALGRISDPRGLVPFIRSEAAKYGIDPDVAVRVAQSEGLANPVGDAGKSHGAFQLYTGGGEGNRFMQLTGMDPADPNNEKATISFALKRAAEVGWKPWHGAKNTGIGEWEGIRRAAVQPIPTQFGQVQAQSIPTQFTGAAPERIPAQLAQAGALPDLPRPGEQRLPPDTLYNSRGEPYSPELLNMPSQERANVAASMAAIQAGAQGTGPRGAFGETSAPQTMPNAAPVRMAQAQAVMPQTPPPPRPDSVPGKTTQRALAVQNFHYWSRAMIAAGMLGEGGRGIMEAAKANIDLAKGYLTAEQEKRLAVQYAPMLEAIKQRAQYLGPGADAPLQGQIAGAQAAARAQAEVRARLQAAGLDPDSPAGQAAARNMLPDTRPDAVRLADAANLTGPGREQAIAGAIPGMALTDTQKLLNAARTAAPAERDIIIGSISGQAPTTDIKNTEWYARQTPEIRDIYDKLQAGNRSVTTINNVTSPILAGIAKRFDEEAGRASGAERSIEAMHTALDMVNAGMISGPGSDQRAFFQRAGELFGLPAEGAANMAAFQSAMGTNVLGLVQELGAGVSISNADRSFAEAMAGGRADLGEASIRRIIEIREKLARQSIDKYNKKVERLLRENPNDSTLQQVAPLMVVPVPPEYNPMQRRENAPAGAAPGQPAAATPGRPPAPDIGEVRGQYRFLGGNPADPKSWQRVQ